MAGFIKIAIPGAFLAIAAAGAFAGAAEAQTSPAASSLTASAPRPATRAAVATASTSTARTSLGRWLCAGGMEMDIRPVSYDDSTSSNEWVVIYKRDGVAYSAERMDRRSAEAVPVESCHRGPAVG